MSIQKFSLSTVRKIRQYVCNTLLLPDSEQQPPSTQTFEEDEEMPEPESLDALGDLFKFGGSPELQDGSASSIGQWIVSAVNPAAALFKLPGVRMRPEIRLVGYVYRDETDGDGVIWAVPEVSSATADLEAALALSNGYDQPPRPANALENFMDAVDGDRSVTSFMIASLVRREFQEFGAYGSRCRWSKQRLVDSLPKKVTVHWKTEKPPKDLIPRGRLLPDGRAAIEFFTCRLTTPLTLVRHIDQYPVDSYTPVSLDRAIATLQRKS